jgi:hypothetical protein
MNRFVDARIPVVFGNAAGPEDVLLVEGPNWAAGHVVGCSCCGGRNEAGRALGRLMVARGRGDVVFFRRVVVALKSDAGRAVLLAALADDPLASVFFRRN